MSDFSDLPLIIEPKDLLHRGDLPNVILVDVGNSIRYQQGHIANAYNIEPQQTLSISAPFGLLPDQAMLQHLLASLGHSKKTTYIVYDDEGGGWAGRFIWLLDSVGHQRYHYLNGGLHAWLKEGLPLSLEIPSKPKSTSPKLVIDKKPTATLEYIQSRLGADDFVVWDARSEAEYDGEKILATKAGHIPDAINFEWTDAMDKLNGLRIRSDIADYLNKLGVTKDKEVVTHCQTHHRSGFTYLILKSLGYNVKAYAGSWSEWGNHPNTVVEI